MLLTPDQIANIRTAIPELRLASDIEIQAYRDRLQAEIDRRDTCDVKDCGRQRKGHGNSDHVFMEKP